MNYSLYSFWVSMVLAMSMNLCGQTTDSLLILQIDSLVDDIHDGFLSSGYGAYHGDGVAFIEMSDDTTIAKWNRDVIYRDTLIYLITDGYVFEKKNLSYREKFYYIDNQVVMYIRTNLNDSITDVTVYFDNGQAILNRDILQDTIFYNLIIEESKRILDGEMEELIETVNFFRRMRDL